jgi:hypothetical protein
MVMLPEMAQVGVTDEFLHASRTMTYSTMKKICDAMFKDRWLVDKRNLPFDIEVPRAR